MTGCRNTPRQVFGWLDPGVDSLWPGRSQEVTQNLVLPNAPSGSRPAQSRSSPADTLFVTTGRKLYVLGDIDGGFRPRSNPYDLYNFGKPLPGDPLANKLQGVWAQPVKALNGYTFEVERDGKTWKLFGAQSFTQTFVEARFEFQQDNLAATRTDFIPMDQPVLLTTLTLKNQASLPVDLKVRFQAYFDLEDAWFTSLAGDRNQGESVSQEGERLVARATSARDAWAVALGAAAVGVTVRIINLPNHHPQGQFEYQVTLQAGAQQSWTFGVAVESKNGGLAALKTLEEGLKQRSAWLDQKQMLYTSLLQAGPRLHSLNPELNLAFDVARANLQMLEADSPVLGRYFYSGLQSFPFWFSAELAYSAPGLAASGLVDSLKNALLVGTRINTDAHIPHQVSPSGQIVWPGNAQETPQWVTAVWDYYRWTGDRDFLASVFPTALKGLLEYTLTTIDQDADNFPSGPGIVEQDGMGAEKLDTAAYTWEALNALEQMAGAMGDALCAARCREKINQIEASFDAIWWDAAEGTYAMSLNETDHARLPAPHWAVITPLEVGLATPAHAAATLETIEASYLNQWGLKHTKGADERVWTLSTAALSRAAFRNKRPDLGLEMLAHIAETLATGSIGLFHELIPEGLCIVQLWSATTFIRGVVEDLLGIQVRADLQALTIAPRLPSDWGEMTLQNLSFAGHVLDVYLSDGKIEVRHISGQTELNLTYRLPSGAEKDFTLNPGEKILLDNS